MEGFRVRLTAQGSGCGVEAQMSEDSALIIWFGGLRSSEEVLQDLVSYFRGRTVAHLH